MATDLVAIAKTTLLYLLLEVAILALVLLPSNFRWKAKERSVLLHMGHLIEIGKDDIGALRKLPMSFLLLSIRLSWPERISQG